jgi:hypothetical protein
MATHDSFLGFYHPRYEFGCSWVSNLCWVRQLTILRGQQLHTPWKSGIGIEVAVINRPSTDRYEPFTPARKDIGKCFQAAVKPEDDIKGSTG